MASTVGTASNVLVGTVKIEADVTGGGTFTDIGYTEEGAEVTVGLETFEKRVEEELDALDEVPSSRDVRLKLKMAEYTLANLHLASAESTHTAGSSNLAIGKSGSNVIKRVSFRLTGVDPAGNDRVWWIPCANPVGETALAFKREAITSIDAEFKAVRAGTGETLITNGEFTSDDTGWTDGGTSWAQSGGVEVCSGVDTLTQTIATMINGASYFVKYDVTGYSTGNCTVSLGGTAGTARSANGTYTEQIVAAAAGGDISFLGASTPAFSIDNVSVYGASLIEIRDN